MGYQLKFSLYGDITRKSSEKYHLEREQSYVGTSQVSVS